MSPIDDVLVALRRVIRATDLHSRQLLKSAGLTAPQLLVLQSVQQRGEASSSELATDINVSQATVTTIIDRLEARGLVRRERSSQDKRKVRVTLLPAGRQALAGSPAPLQENFTRQFQALEKWEQTQLIASLQRIAHMMDAQDIDASPVLDVGELDRSGQD